MMMGPRARALLPRLSTVFAVRFGADAAFNALPLTFFLLFFLWLIIGRYSDCGGLFCPLNRRRTIGQSLVYLCVIRLVDTACLLFACSNSVKSNDDAKDWSQF